MKERKNTLTASGKKVGRPRTLTDAERKAKAEAYAARLTEWKNLHMRDPKYREELKRRAAERKAQLAADAELGRMTRAFLMRLGEMIIGIATPRDPAKGDFKHKSFKELTGLPLARRPLTPEQAGALVENLTKGTK